jgi:2-polyprenyl-3-methyl-5-hydroxy-6-metoxy-1,4-benzoquinol methylase
MKSEEISIEYYEKVGPAVLDSRLSGRRDDLPFVKRFCTKRHAILDLACGAGRITIPLVQAGYDVRGIDLSPTLVREAKKRLKDCALNPGLIQKGSMLDIPAPADSFDRIICLWTAFNELLEKREQVIALNEMERVLRQGGIAFLDLVNGERKEIKNTLATRGTGWRKMVSGWNIDGAKHMCFLHDRESLAQICGFSKFDTFEVRFMNLNRQRRLVAFLKK